MYNILFFDSVFSSSFIVKYKKYVLPDLLGPIIVIIFYDCNGIFMSLLRASGKSPVNQSETTFLNANLLLSM